MRVPHLPVPHLPMPQLPGPDDFAVGRRFDEAAEDALDLVRGHPVADRFAYAVSEAANFSAVWHVLAWLPVLRDRRAAPRAAAISLAMATESLVVNGWVKQFFRRGRPVHTDSRPHHLRVPLTSSFPSGHASSAVMAAALLGQDRRLRPVVYPLAVAVATSRAYVRIHHASDVVGGAVVGGLLAAVARRLVPRPRR